MVDKELIEIWKNMLKPAISLWLLNTNYEEMGEQDKEEFERDFDEILDLALIGLKYKAQLSLEDETCSTADTISRKAVIRWVKTECNPYGKPTLDFESGKRVTGHLEQMPSSQPEPKWIPCSERLPENGRQVLVYAISTHFALAKYDEMREADGSYIKQWVTFDAWKPFYRVKDVIAWMELPEPCKR